MRRWVKASVKPVAAAVLRLQVSMPFRSPAEEGRRPGRSCRLDDPRRFDQRRRDRGGADLQRLQHSRRIAPKAVIALRDMGERVSLHRVGQPGGVDDQLFQIVPAAAGRDRLVQRGVVAPRRQQRGAEGEEGAQGVLHGRLGVHDPGVAQALRIAPGLADDPVVCFDDGVRDGEAPLHHADRENGEAAITGNILQPVREIALALSAQPSNPMGRNPGQAIGIEADRLQELQPIQQAVHIGRVLARLEPAQPDEPAHLPVHRLAQQRVEPGAHVLVKTIGDAGFNRVYRNKGTPGPIELSLIPDAHDGLSAGAELAGNGRDRLSVLDFVAHDLLLIG